jgi:hypothetical protein
LNIPAKARNGKITDFRRSGLLQNRSNHPSGIENTLCAGYVSRKILADSKTSFILVIPNIALSRTFPALALLLPRPCHVLQCVTFGFLSLNAISLHKDVPP